MPSMSRRTRTVRSLLAVGLATQLVACGDDETGSGGAGNTTTGTSTTTATTTQSSGPTTSSSGSSSSSESSSESSSGSAAITSGGSSSSGGDTSPGCGNAGAPTGEAMRTVDIQGTERHYIVDAPVVVDADKPLALVFVFHGNGGNGQASQGMGLQNVEGAQEDAVFVFPDGLPFMGFGVGWNGSCDGYDMEFFDTMIETLSNDFCIDASRIFAAGFSWGGDMCQSLACCRGDVVRAIAPASGPEFYPPDQVCTGTERPAFRMTYATNDAYPPQMFADTIDYYRGEHGCADTSTPVSPDPCIAHDGCQKPVIACEYEGLGHAWPNDWADETWKFFGQQ
jgi:polyhydroxybutyrate depolymerase